MNNLRIKKSVRNTSIALLEQVIFNILSFICRTIFIYTLGKTYLGFSGLFNDILVLLSLGELGVGTAILYSMYKPAAENDYETISGLLNLYKKVYHTIGIILTIFGLMLTPFLNRLISNMPQMKELPLIYILYLLNTTASYFFIYKKSILIVDQKNYIASLIYILSSSVQNILQITFLLLTHNYIIYLSIQVICTLINNICISIYVDKNYIYLKKYKNARISKEQRSKIFLNVKAMFVSKLSSAIVTSTDNLLISKFVSTIILGVYSNYTLFTTMIKTIVAKIFEALTGSVGNLVAKESKEHVYKTFGKIWFINYWLVAFCCSMLFAFVNQFIDLWIGQSYLLNQSIVAIICINLYMRLIRNTFLLFNDAYGLFTQLRIKCIAEALINLIVSLIFTIVFSMGIYGILLGTFVSNITTNFWFEPYILFKKKFNVSMYVYFQLFFKYFCVTGLSSGLIYYIRNYILLLEGWSGFIVESVFCCIIINLFYILMYSRTDEFKYLKQLMYEKVVKKIFR